MTPKGARWRGNNTRNFTARPNVLRFRMVFLRVQEHEEILYHCSATVPAAHAAHEVRQRCLTAVPRKSDQPGSSDLQIVKVGNARFHHVQVHFDEVILDAAGFRRGKDLLPVQSVLSHRHHFLGFR